MELTLRVVERRGAYVHYVIEDEQGHVVKDVRDTFTAEVADAKRLKTSLSKVLAKREGITNIELPGQLEPDATSFMSSSTQEVADPDYDYDHEHDYAAKDHPHPGHEHPFAAKAHGHEDEQQATKEAIARNEANWLSAVASLGRRLDSYRVSMEERIEAVASMVPSITQRLANLEEWLRVQQAHQHYEFAQAEHGHLQFAELGTQLADLGFELAELRKKLSEQAHSHNHLATAEHAHAPTKHPEIAVLEEKLAEAGKQASWRILSRENTAGHERLVVEEVK